MNRWASGGIIRSWVTSKYQLGLFLHAGLEIAPLTASFPHGTCESAMKAAFLGSTSAAKEAANFSLSNDRNPFSRGTIGGTGAPGAGFAIREPTDSPLSGAKAVMYTSPTTFG